MNTVHAQWPRIATLFHQAVTLSPEQRKGFLAEHCQGDDALLRQVTELLEADNDLSASWPGLAVPAPTMPPTADPVPILPGYTDLKLLGRGGMGTVYRACRHDRVFAGKTFAVKVLHAHRTSERSKRRFDTERRLLADLDHPGIVRLYDGGELADGRPYLVMDYIEGRPLDAYCRQERLTVEQRLHLFLKVCGALHYAHQNLVVHRDLKPSNILVDTDGDPRLLDFGIAKRLYDAAGAKETTGWLVPMTPAYASPEQLAGESVTTASDLYSLGLLLFELLTDRLPDPPLQHQTAQGESPRPSAAVTVAQAAACRTTVPRLQRRLAGDLDHIVGKALRVEPRARYASARELAEDVERHLGALPVLARRGSWRYLGGRFLHRHRLGVAIACSALLVLAFGLAVGIQSNRLAVAQAAGAQSERLIRSLVGPEVDQQMDAGDLDRVLAAIAALSLADEHKALLIDLFRRMQVPEEQLVDQVVALLQAQLEPTRPSGPNQRASPATREADADLARVALVVGESVYHRGRFTASEAILGAARSSAGASYDQDSVELAPYLEAHASALAELERYPEGVAALQHSIRLRREDPTSGANVVEPLLGLSSLFYLQGAFAESAATARQALAILGPGVDEDPVRRASALTSLAVALMELTDGDPNGEIEALAREALALRIEAFGPAHIDTINARNNLAAVLGKAGKVAESLAFSLENLEYIEATFGRKHHRLGYILTMIARAHHDLGHAEACVHHAQRAVAVRKESLPVGNWLTAISQARLGDCLGDLGQTAEAIAVLRTSIATFEHSKVEDTQWLDMARTRLAEQLAIQGATGAES